MFLHRFPRLVLMLAAFAILAVPANALTIEDDRGTVELDGPASRVVALSWAAVEQVVGLNVKPLAIADVEGYRTWVARPELPEGVADVGLRNEPSIERIAELKPDLIIATDDQIDLVPRLEKIAPVLYFKLFSADHDNFEAGKAAFLKVAAALGKRDFGEERLAKLDAGLKAEAARITETFGDDPPKVATIRFMTTALVRLYADNAMAVHAAEAIGLQHPLPQPATAWGIAQKKVEDLAAIEDGIVIYIEPFDEKGALFSEPIWQFMPFVRSGRFTAIQPTWTYGGPLSVGYLAEAIADAVIDLDAPKGN
ncbi:ABC transporter substrate-binding protein [Pararhizobium haloflavum]|uniref:ABC transporter substrate-binding protein n=1 Tax=Pararhizobium haloflavum TaxID=2037914 RepID=UPI0018E43ED0|nr:iron-siderophore ABC transporter substrate-binding protein [Pararhizobium haloflavum]